LRMPSEQLPAAFDAFVRDLQAATRGPGAQAG